MLKIKCTTSKCATRRSIIILTKSLRLYKFLLKNFLGIAFLKYKVY